MDINNLFILLLLVALSGVSGLVLACLPTQKIRRWWLARKRPQETCIILYLMAPPKQPYRGYELWQALTAAQLEYGEMKIFHYFFQTPTGPQHLFSVSSAVEPGYFDLADIGAICCPGLCLFMQIQSTANPRLAFNRLLETAKQLAQELGGTLCDTRQQLFTEATRLSYEVKL